VSISEETRAILTQIFSNFLQSLQVGARMKSRLGHNRFLSNYLQSTILQITSCVYRPGNKSVIKRSTGKHNATECDRKFKPGLFSEILKTFTSFNSFDFHLFTQQSKKRGSALGIATGYGLDGRGAEVWVPAGSRILTYPYRPDRIWGPPNLLSNVYMKLFPRG
jgi:hypothetical protein